MSELPRDLDAGRYRLVERIGRGAYGEVFRAVQTSVDRTVAVKVVHAHLEARDDVAERFRREARLTSRLDHPCAVRVIDFGESDGSLYLVMDFVEGPTLKSVLAAEGPLAPDRVRRIVRGVAGALGAAHRIGLVHRDLKPANILLPSDERPVVIDFGLVKVFSGEDDGAAVTRSNVMIGTPGYLSPEAVVGQSVDGRSDLYALGVLLFELLVGRRPFQGKTVLEVATARLHEPAPELPRSCPADLRRLAAWLLAREPDARPPTADDVVACLDGRGAGDDERRNEPDPPPADATIAPSRGPGARVVGAAAPVERDPTPPTAPRRVAPRPRRPWLAPGAVAIVAAALALGALWARGDEPPDGDADAAVAVGGAAAGGRAVESGAEEASGGSGVPTATADTATLETEPSPTAPKVPDTGATGPGDSLRTVSPVDLQRSTDAETRAPDEPTEPRRPSADEVPSRPRTGTLTVNIEPWGEVWVDGERHGEAPIRALEVEAGQHTIRTRYLDQERQERVFVERGEDTSVTHRFVR